MDISGKKLFFLLLQYQNVTFTVNIVNSWENSVQ